MKVIVASSRKLCLWWKYTPVSELAWVPSCLISINSHHRASVFYSYWEIYEVLWQEKNSYMFVTWKIVYIGFRSQWSDSINLIVTGKPTHTLILDRTVMMPFIFSVKYVSMHGCWRPPCPMCQPSVAVSQKSSNFFSALLEGLFWKLRMYIVSQRKKLARWQWEQMSVVAS